MSKVKPIPDGMHTITPYLICDGATDAIAFYVKAFGAVERFRLADPKGKIMNAMIQIGDSMLMLNDEFSEMGMLGPKSLKGSPVTIHLSVADVDASVKRAVDAGAKITMPVADMFWGDRYGALADPFGHLWSVATHLRDMSPDEIQQAMAKAMA